MQISGIEEASETQGFWDKSYTYWCATFPRNSRVGRMNIMGDYARFILECREIAILQKIFSGYMDQLNIKDSGESSTIEVKVESKLVDLDRNAAFSIY